MNLSRIFSEPAKLFILAMAFVTALSASANRVLADDAAWQVVSATNAEILAPGGTWQPLAADTTLAAESQIRVGPGGGAVLISGGDTVTLSPNSQMMVPKAVPGGPSILQKLGTLLFRIEKRQPTLHQNANTGQPKISIFNVQTPYLAAVIKGTVFSVNVSEQGAALHVAEGLVETISLSSGERGLVGPGQTARVSSLPGAVMTISNGGRVQPGNRGRQAAAGSGNSASSQASAPGRAKAGPKGLRSAVVSGVDITKGSKGLLRLASTTPNNANAGRALGKGDVPGNSVKGNAKTPGQMYAGSGGVGTTPGVLPNGNTFHGNGNAYGLNGGNPGGGNGNGNPGGGNPNNNPGNNNGSNGCNGNGNKPGC